MKIEVSNISSPIGLTDCDERISVKMNVEAFGCEENSVSASELFQIYENANFLYPQKKQLLDTNLSLIESNWSRAMARRLLRVVTFKGSTHKIEASVAVWRSSSNGWLDQHLVAISNPLAAWSVMRAVGAMRAKERDLASSQNWYRPNNRFANRFFGSVVNTVGFEHCDTVPYSYLKVMRHLPEHEPLSTVIVDDTKLGLSDQFRDFVRQHRGGLFLRAEEILDADMCLPRLNADFATAGLFRRRHVVFALDRKRDRLMGVALIYRGPLGLNFSFLENRTDLIADPHLDVEVRADVNHSLLRASLKYYSDYELDWIPVVLHPTMAVDLTRVSVHLRDYNQFICIKAGFNDYILHLNDFYENVLKILQLGDNR
jgi:hypothetical protein